MVNSTDFANRLKKIFDFYDLSASSFADKIDVGRASISHLLSGRNKPSLDFVMKVVSTFEEVELYWLLNGKGSFPSSPVQEQASDKAEAEEDHLEATSAEKDDLDSIENQVKTTPNKEIEKVIIFYTDGSFKSYENYPKN